MASYTPIASNSLQLFHTFLCNSQNYHPGGAVDDPMALLHEAEIVVLLPNSELTKDNNKRTYGSFIAAMIRKWSSLAQQ